MNSIVKYLLCFVGGALVGFAGTSLFYKKKIKSLEEEFDAMDKHYQEQNPKVAPYVRKTSEKDDVEQADESKDKPVLTSSNSIVRGAMRYEKPDDTDYTAFWNKTDPAEKESPEEDDDDDGYSQGLMLNKERKENEFKPPKLIKANEYGDQPGFATVDLHYYQGNDFLTVASDMNEDDLLYESEIDEYVGDALTKFNFKSSNEKTIYVRNYQRATDFMITKIFSSFGEE